MPDGVQKVLERKRWLQTSHNRVCGPRFRPTVLVRAYFVCAHLRHNPRHTSPHRQVPVQWQTPPWNCRCWLNVSLPCPTLLPQLSLHLTSVTIMMSCSLNTETQPGRSGQVEVRLQCVTYKQPSNYRSSTWGCKGWVCAYCHSMSVLHSQVFLYQPEQWQARQEPVAGRASMQQRGLVHGDLTPGLSEWNQAAPIPEVQGIS